MQTLILPLLLVVLVVVLITLGISLALWHRTSSLAGRVTRLEVYQENNLTHAETRQIYERLSSIEGQIQTNNQLMQTVQKHLLEMP